MVTIPLTPFLREIIGTPKEGKEDAKVFPNLPSYWKRLVLLKKWTKAAGIQKNITWHCARHTFATLLLSKGANIVAVKELMGHSDINQTMVYARALDKDKREAMNTLNIEL